ncbi:unnamed protein product [Heterobilharzia americana]|nr:unnamed protein product [Heterobilharzia americana]
MHSLLNHTDVFASGQLKYWIHYICIYINTSAFQRYICELFEKLRSSLTSSIFHCSNQVERISYILIHIV